MLLIFGFKGFRFIGNVKIPDIDPLESTRDYFSLVYQRIIILFSLRPFLFRFVELTMTAELVYYQEI